MEGDLNELHNLANTAFQNVSNLTPALRHLVANAKIYQKSVQTTCNLAVMFIESLQAISNAASASEGATKKIGEVMSDIMDAFKEIENMKLELTKLFINEVIIPLESKAEIEISNTKSTHKSYNQENKIQTELTEKARAGVSKIRKKTTKKKKLSPKLEQKEKSNIRTLDEEESKLKKIREEGLRKALIEERRMYCFVAERMCSYGRGMIVYNNRISNFVNQKIPDWQQYISKPTELPADSESIISNPTGYKMGTVRSKITKSDKKESIRRGKSFNSHFPTKYSTIDGRASRAGSRPSLAAFSMTSGTATPRTVPQTPRLSPTRSTNGAVNPLFPTPPHSVTEEGGVIESNGSVSKSPVFAPDMTETPVGLYVAPSSDQHSKSEYANLVSLNTDVGIIARSQSFSASPVVKSVIDEIHLVRADNTAVQNEVLAPQEFRRSMTMGGNQDGMSSELSSKLAMIQSQLSQKLNVKSPTDNQLPRQYLKALYKHEAQDASQLSFEKDDIIIPVCDQTSGWQYGENEKTKKSGWFPAAFTEEVVINGTSGGHTSTSPRKAPAVMAKKASCRKVSVASTQIVQSSCSSKDFRSGSLGDVPHIPTSSSVPELIHSLADQKEYDDDNVNIRHERKHSNSFQGINRLNDIDVSLELNDDADSIDSMPPPPPPPPMSDRELNEVAETPTNESGKLFQENMIQSVAPVS